MNKVGLVFTNSVKSTQNTNTGFFFSTKKNTESVSPVPKHIEIATPEPIAPVHIIAEPEPTLPIIPEPTLPIVPEPTLPEPTLPEPTLPEPIIPEPIAPEPITSVPTTPELNAPEPFAPELNLQENHVTSESNVELEKLHEKHHVISGPEHNLVKNPNVKHYVISAPEHDIISAQLELENEVHPELENEVHLEREASNSNSHIFWEETKCKDLNFCVKKEYSSTTLL